MKVKQVLKHYHKKVPFPLTLRKIVAAGYNPADYLAEMGKKLEQCEDSEDSSIQKVIQALRNVQD